MFIKLITVSLSKLPADLEYLNLDEIALYWSEENPLSPARLSLQTHQHSLQTHQRSLPTHKHSRQTHNSSIHTLTMVRITSLLAAAALAPLAAAAPSTTVEPRDAEHPDLRRRDYNSYPVHSMCFATCNSVMHEARAMGCNLGSSCSNGALNEICRGGSVFMDILRSCRQCVDANLNRARDGDRIHPAPNFYPYIFLCVG
jgi:hypothetical protein